MALTSGSVWTMATGGFMRSDGDMGGTWSLATAGFITGQLALLTALHSATVFDTFAHFAIGADLFAHAADGADTFAHKTNVSVNST